MWPSPSNSPVITSKTNLGITNNIRTDVVKGIELITHLFKHNFPLSKWAATVERDIPKAAAHSVLVLKGAYLTKQSPI